MLEENIKGVRLDRIPLVQDVYKEQTIVFVLNNRESAQYLYSKFIEIHRDSGHEIVLLDAHSSDPYETSVYDHDLFLRRAEALSKIALHDKKIIITYIASINYNVPPIEYFHEHIRFEVGTKIPINSIIQTLNSFGYTRVGTVLAKCQFAVRGGIIDIYSPFQKTPVRIDFFGDDIERLRIFDTDTQISSSNIDYLIITKCSEIILNDQSKHLFKQRYNLKNTRILEFIENGQMFPGIEWFSKMFHVEHFSIAHWFSESTRFVFDFQSEQHNKEFFKKLKNLYDSHNDVPHYSEIFSDSIELIKNKFKAVNLSFEWREIQKQRPVQRQRTRNFMLEFSKLQVGDFVVHEKHGVAQFESLSTLDVLGIRHDFLTLVYANNDKLYVPVENIGLITRYGDKDSDVQVDSLKGNSWAHKKINVRKRLLIIANDLLKLAAKRQMNKIEPLEIPERYEEFCKGFKYIETDDQMSAIEDVLNDLRGNIPMDRLICGDVGFGKTEVAIRGAFVVAANLKQVVILTPTTILANQHYKNFTKRFKGFGIEICQISRFASRKEMNENLRRIENGEVQIVVATHAILSKKIKFADLGMVIVDEEQHFGVKQKELLKGLHEKVHFMTMSATPIPRTLQLAMSGLKDLSLIATPPMNRRPVKMIISDFEKSAIKRAIEQEISVGGQVFFVTPRVEFLDRLFDLTKALFPNLHIGKCHGKSDEIEDTINAFCNHELDVLVSTNIVDSGIDIPNANTILINRFDLFGLSQLYQLRGRVGRSTRQAYAVLLLDKDKPLSQNAMKRLDVLNSLDALGSGFTLASHDLDIRGAGNLLGEEQSGAIKDVGVELYQTMLREAILMLKAGCDIQEQEKKDAQINLGVPVLIPADYIENDSLRLEMYRRIGALDDYSRIDCMEFELEDRFGEIPQETRNLLILMEIKMLCEELNIEKLDVGSSGFVFSFFENHCKNVEGLLKFLASDKLKTFDGSGKIRSDQKIVISKKWNNVNERTLDIKNMLHVLKELSRG